MYTSARNRRRRMFAGTAAIVALGPPTRQRSECTHLHRLAIAAPRRALRYGRRDVGRGQLPFREVARSAAATAVATALPAVATAATAVAAVAAVTGVEVLMVAAAEAEETPL